MTTSSDINRDRQLLAPTLGTGALMAGFLLLRPWGDAAGGLDAARAWASPRWAPAHLCGALALASFARLALRLSDRRPSPLSRAARWFGLSGATLAGFAFGAEGLGLTVLGRYVVAHPTALDLVAGARDTTIGAATLGLGLAGLGVSGTLTALVWQQTTTGPARFAAWPLGVGVALIIPHFFLPPAGRVGFGVAYFGCAVVLAAAIMLSERHPARPPAVACDAALVGSGVGR